MMSSMDSITCASLPIVQLERLASIRSQKQVKGRIHQDKVWLLWNGNNQNIAELLFPIPGAELYERKEDHWHLFQRQLPSFNVPDLSEARPLAELLFPESIPLLPLPSVKLQPLAIKLVADSNPRESAAMLCQLSELHDWLETVPGIRIAELKALRKGNSVLIFGTSLPEISEGQRFWGKRIFVPLGNSYEPFFDEFTMIKIIDLASTQVLFIQHHGIECIDISKAQPLSRASVRLALMPGDR